MCRGFTKFARDDYLQWKKEGRLVNDGVNAKVRAAVVVTPGVMTSCLLQGAAGASGMSPATRPAEQEHVGKKYTIWSWNELVSGSCRAEAGGRGRL